MIKISIIIPVYNAAAFVEEAVESAINQPETGEVILIEDKSHDNSLQICKEISDKFDKVKLFQHPDKENHGAGASRNLGIMKAQEKYIAFLDSDDFFNPDRFSLAIDILKSDSSVDGVYEAIGAMIDSSVSNSSLKSKSLTTINGMVSPKDLLEVLSLGNYGHFSGDGLLVKKNIFNKCGYFENYPVGEDTHMWMKMAAVGKLVPGSLDKPVAMRRVHADNRITAASGETMKKYRLMMWESLKKWSEEQSLGLDVRTLFDFMDFHSRMHSKGDISELFKRSNYLRSLIKYSYSHSPDKTVAIVKKFLNKLFKGF